MKVYNPTLLLFFFIFLCMSCVRVTFFFVLGPTVFQTLRHNHKANRKKRYRRGGTTVLFHFFFLDSRPKHRTIQLSTLVRKLVHLILEPLRASSSTQTIDRKWSRVEETIVKDGLVIYQWIHHTSLLSFFTRYANIFFPCIAFFFSWYPLLSPHSLDFRFEGKKRTYCKTPLMNFSFDAWSAWTEGNPGYPRKRKEKREHVSLE